MQSWDLVLNQTIMLRNPVLFWERLGQEGGYSLEACESAAFIGAFCSRDKPT